MKTMKGALLALDLGTRTGWALLSKHGAFHTGIWDLGNNKKKEQPDPRVLALDELVMFHVSAHDVAYVAYEEPLPHNRSAAQVKLSRAFATTVELAGHKANAQVVSVPAGTLKKWATGHGNSKKPHMIAAAWGRWERPEDRERWVLVDPKKEWIKDPELASVLTEIPPPHVPDDNQVDAVWVANWALYTLELRPEKSCWDHCPCCDGFVCLKHLEHAHDCPCPPIEEWTSDPYVTKKARPRKKTKDKKLRHRNEGEAPHSWGYVQQEMFG